MSNPSNLYAEKIFSEHPISLWALDEQLDYINLIEESQRDAVFEHWDRAIEEKRNFEETVQIMDKKGNKYSTMCVATIQQDGKYIGSLTEIKQI